MSIEVVTIITGKPDGFSQVNDNIEEDRNAGEAMAIRRAFALFLAAFAAARSVLRLIFLI
jgi:hypothetical protein